MTGVEPASGSAAAIRTPRFAPLALLALSALCGAPQITLATCRLAKFELPVTMRGEKPLISARVNGAAALFVADSGASFNVMPPGAAARFRLPVGPAPYSLHLGGVTGEGAASLATVRTFTLGGVPIPDVEFFVIGNEMAAGAAGVLGESVLGMFDTEYDLANGMIRLMQPRDCARSVLAYWASNRSYSVVDLERPTPRDPKIIGTAYLNGEKIRVMFDSGAAASIVRLRAAQHAGARPGGPGVVAAGFVHGAIGQQALPTWIAPFTSFKIGDEEILHTRLRIGDISLRDADMLLGVDFFLSHRIYVATSQGKLYFTYNGGPVFNLATSAGPAAPSPAASGASDEPGDAAGFARRGSAFIARHEFERAIADLTRACELAPNEADDFYERGVARVGARQPELALADFDQALRLRPDDVPALEAGAGGIAP